MAPRTFGHYLLSFAATTHSARWRATAAAETSERADELARVGSQQASATVGQRTSGPFSAAPPNRRPPQCMHACKRPSDFPWQIAKTNKQPVSSSVLCRSAWHAALSAGLGLVNRCSWQNCWRLTSLMCMRRRQRNGCRLSAPARRRRRPTLHQRQNRPHHQPRQPHVPHPPVRPSSGAAQPDRVGTA
jgi:hypothetical protein